MNLVKRLRNRETAKNKQQFVCTPKMLQALTTQPDIVIPVCSFPTSHRHLIVQSIANFLRKHQLPTTLDYVKMTLFRIHNEDALFYKTYVLIYGYKNYIGNLDFNLYNKIHFTCDIFLQAGRECK